MDEFTINFKKRLLLKTRPHTPCAKRKRCYDVTLSRQGRKYNAPPSECTLCDRSCRYYIQDVFFWRLAGSAALTGKAIVHWIGCINAIKWHHQDKRGACSHLIAGFNGHSHCTRCHDKGKGNDPCVMHKDLCNLCHILTTDQGA